MAHRIVPRTSYDDSAVSELERSPLRAARLNPGNSPGYVMHLSIDIRYFCSGPTPKSRDQGRAQRQ